MAATRPSFQWYTGDWMKDPGVRSLSLAARGLWFDMLNLMDQSPRRGYLQMPSGKLVTATDLARMTGSTTDETSLLLRELENAGVYSLTESGVIFSRRMVRDERKRQLCSEAGARGGGNPTLKGSLKGGCDPPFIGGIEGEDEQALALYESYPRKVGKGAALLSIKRALARESFDVLIEAVQAFAKARQGQDQQFTPHPSTWFNQDRWKDDRNEWHRRNRSASSGQGPKSREQNREESNAAELQKFLSRQGYGPGVREGDGRIDGPEKDNGPD